MKFHLCSLLASFLPLSQAIVHPGIFNSKADLERMKTSVAAGTQPWAGSFNILINDPMGNLDWTPNPVANITSTNGYMRPDSAGAYLAALRWYITADKAHLNKAIEIINAYVNTVTNVDFAAQITGYIAALKFSGAVEIVRLSNAWTTAYQSAFNTWAYNVLYTPICHVGLYGTGGRQGDGNQGIGDMRCIMAIGIATDNATMYNEAVYSYKNDPCCSLTNYIDSYGCTGEAGRDMAHPQGALEEFTDMAKMAQLQGDTSLWSYGGNRLATAWEWMAKRNLLNETVPFTKTRTCYTAYSSLSSGAQGKLVPGYSVPFYYYANNGVPMPYSAKVLYYHGPELGGGSGEDTLYGTLVNTIGANTTAPIITPGTYNIKPLNTALYVGAASSTAQLTLATTPTMSWVFKLTGNDVYRISPSTDTSIALFCGNLGCGTNTVPFSADNAIASQDWKVIKGANGGLVFTTQVSIMGYMPRSFTFLTTAGGSGTKLIMSGGTNSTSTTNTAQEFTLTKV